jgi:hypothetical protein
MYVGLASGVAIEDCNFCEHSDNVIYYFIIIGNS